MNDLEVSIANVVAVASEYADAVDIHSRFPKEAVAELKKNKLLGAYISTSEGGLGLKLPEIAKICFSLGEVCGSTGLIYAMHQIEVAMLIGNESDWTMDYMGIVADQQLLLASVTSEKGIGGSIRTSACAIEDNGDGTFNLTKDATTISYGAYADGLLITSRTKPDSSPGEQSLSVITKDQYSLNSTTSWNTMGMRGTCSNGFVVRAQNVPNEQILPIPFADLSANIMLPVSHILWSSVWLGIASNALGRARSYLRAQAKVNPGANMPPGAVRLVEASAKLKAAHSLIKEALSTYDDFIHSKLNNRQTVEMNNLKVMISEMTLDIVNQAMMICGISGYKNENAYSLGRHLRDIHSARLMVSNDRIVLNNSSFTVTQRSKLVEF